MRSAYSARCLLLAVSCLSAGEAACTTQGGVIGMAPEGSGSASSSKAASNSGTDAGRAVASHNFKPLLNAKGVDACMQITEKDVPTNYLETVALGTAAGAILLALLGAAAGAVLTGGSGDGAAAGAIAGGAVGAGLGGADGVRTAEQKQNFAIQIARYDCQIQAAQIENESLEGAGGRLKASIADLNSQLDALEEAYANKRLNRVEAQKELNDIDDASGSLKHRLAAMKESTEKFEKYSASTEDLAKGADLAIDQARTSSLDGQIAEMNERNRQLEQEYAELAERRKAVVLQ